MSEAHAGVARGHYAGKATVRKILQAGLWWPTIHMDTKSFCKCCDIFKRTRKPSHRNDMSLAQQITLQAFNQSEINFVGMISPP